MASYLQSPPDEIAALVAVPSDNCSHTGRALPQTLAPLAAGLEDWGCDGRGGETRAVEAGEGGSVLVHGGITGSLRWHLWRLFNFLTRWIVLVFRGGG